MAKRLLLVALCLSTLSVAASGCGDGGSSGAKAGDWAADVCSAASEWAAGIQADGQTVGGGQNLKGVKAKYVTFLEKAVRRSDTLLFKVKAAGPPPGKNGDALERDVKAARDSLSNALPKAKALPTTDQPTFSRKVFELGKDVGKKLAAMGQTFSRLGGPACKKLSSGSG